MIPFDSFGSDKVLIVCGKNAEKATFAAYPQLIMLKIPLASFNPTVLL
jgi:hypothetical protein